MPFLYIAVCVCNLEFSFNEMRNSTQPLINELDFNKLMKIGYFALNRYCILLSEGLLRMPEKWFYAF